MSTNRAPVAAAAGQPEDGGLAAPLDALLVQAALGPARRFAPDSSTARWALSLVRHPRRTLDRAAAATLWEAVRNDRMEEYLAQHHTTSDTLGDSVR